MMISKAVVESIYSMEPPGRFLKKCADTGQWMELSKREAADKAAQAMAYVVRARARGEATKERRSPPPLPLATTTSQPSDRPLPPLHANIDSAEAGNGASAPMAMAHVPAARVWGERRDTTHATSAADHNTDSDSDPGGRNKHLSLQQQLPPWQQASITTTSGLGAPLNGLAQTVAQAQLLQLYHQRQFSLWYHFMSQHSLGLQTGLLSAPSLGLPSTQFLSAPSSSAQGVSLPPTNSLLRREHLLQGNYGYGTGAQLSTTLLQSQGNNMQLDDPNVLQSMMGNYQSTFVTAIDPPQEAQQVGRVQRGATLQHHQLSSLTDTSALPSRQQSPPLGLPQPAALLQQNSSQDPPPSIINSTAAKLESSANATVPSTRDSSSKGQTEDDDQR
jgi:hypothetical protein